MGKIFHHDRLDVHCHLDESSMELSGNLEMALIRKHIISKQQEILGPSMMSTELVEGGMLHSDRKEWNGLLLEMVTFASWFCLCFGHGIFGSSTNQPNQIGTSSLDILTTYLLSHFSRFRVHSSPYIDVLCP